MCIFAEIVAATVVRLRFRRDAIIPSNLAAIAVRARARPWSFADTVAATVEAVSPRIPAIIPSNLAATAALASAMPCSFAETVAVTVATLIRFSAASKEANFAAIADLATAAVSAFDMRTRFAAICFARRSIGRFSAARSLLVPTSAGTEAFR